MNIAVGTDHRGLDYKLFVINILKKLQHNPIDCGTYSTAAVDYPDIARQVCDRVLKGQADYGILICGTGIGMSIAANKIKGIRAGLVWDTFGAERSRLHNNANVLCLGAERGEEGVAEIISVFLKTPFEGGRHQKRLDKITGLEQDCN
jgi:ribose 5-phosphate isomerase B